MKNPEYLAYFAGRIERELGIVYGEHNYFQLESRLQDVARSANFTCAQALFEAIQSGTASNLMPIVLSSATNNETSFFRDPKVFDALQNKMIPDVISQLAPVEKIKIWSAASSCGQEPYSVAMLLDTMGSKGTARAYDIVATDIAPKILERAQTGRYSHFEVQRGLPMPKLLTYFTKGEDESWTVIPRIRASIQFRLQNLKEPFNVGWGFHIILCRNVLIYQSVESKTEIVKRLGECLVPGGYLVLGTGETLLGITNNFESCTLDGAVFYRKSMM